MVKLQFSNLQDLQSYLKSPDLVNRVFTTERVRKLVAREVSKSVEEVVYKAYTPKLYTRRGKNGGLADPENVRFSKVEIIGDRISIFLENTTQGQTQFIPIYSNGIDSLNGKEITDTIERGIESNWYRTGEWSKPRPFIQRTIENIKANPQPLVNAIKTGFRQAGISVR